MGEPIPAGAATHGAMRTSILVIEHDPRVMRELLTTLEAGGHRVVLATDTRAAISMLVQEHFDLVLTDAGSTDMSGAELARRVRSWWPTSAPPFVLYADEADEIVEDAETHFAAAVSRSARPVALLMAIADVLARARSPAPRERDSVV